jgi:alpha-ketoglutarate-dependent taurine dioxygenase
MANPFELHNTEAWLSWRDQKRASYPADLEALIVEVNDLVQPTKAEQEKIRQLCQRCNMALFATDKPENVSKEVLQSFGVRFGLQQLNFNEGADDDGVTAISVVEAQWRQVYIPYTNRPINWHTDGYYNEPTEWIRGMILYCETPAPEGGENALIDHEMAYLHLREINPDFIRALMQPDVMTIPANEVNDHIERPDRPGPVFSVDADGHLHMRYTARARNIVWKDEPLVISAVKALKDFLNSDSPLIFRGTLQSGQGLICNNILHDRSGFTDSQAQKRLLYRLRYFDRMVLS